MDSTHIGQVIINKNLWLKLIKDFSLRTVINTRSRGCNHFFNWKPVIT